MARRAVPLRAVFGAASAALMLTLTLGTLIAVAMRAEGVSGFGPGDWGAIRFTITQALISAALSVLGAIPVARALARRRFAGRGFVIALLGAPFILPVIVAVLGLVAAFGQNGIINSALQALGLPTVSLYGFHGVILAHVFYNLPLATRLILQGWLAVPGEKMRLAGSLNFAPRDIQRHIEWPMLRETAPGAFLVIFLLCLTSFAVALAVGGGPRATTVELAIYQAFRFDFDLGKAALLALVQFGLCACVGLVAFWIALPQTAMAGLDGVQRRWDADGLALRIQDCAAIGLACLFLIGPMTLVLWGGVPALIDLPGTVWRAAGTSIAIALVSMALTLCLSLSLVMWAEGGGRAGRALGEGIGALALAASPLVMGTGLFILIFPFANPQDLALSVTIAVNAAVSVPFAVRVLAPALRELEASYGALADSLALSGWARLRWLILPRLRRPLGFAAGLSAALSMGDLGVITLFSQQGNETLPLAMYQLMGAYRLDQAAGAALLLVLLSFGLFWAFDRGGRVNADT